MTMTENNNNYFSQTTGEKTGEPTGAMLVQPDRQLVWDYSNEIESSVDPDKFFDYYEEKRWKIGGEPIRDWKALFRSWNKNEFKKKPKKRPFSYRFGEDPVDSAALEAFMRS